MWSPADKRALPSKEDRIQAKIAIQRVKGEIEATEARLAQTQLRLDMLRKELAEREAWLAPVRKLSHDELTIIFNMCAEVDWTALMNLAAVCRIWRGAILANSRPWSFILLNSRRALKLVPLYLERSSQRMLRVALSGSTRPEYYTSITQMADRIQCLSVPAFSGLLDGITFPFLNRLHLLAEGYPMTILGLNRSRFPALRGLDVYFPEQARRYFIDEAVDFPLLQTLRLDSHLAVDFMPIVHKCGQHLTSLDFTIPWGVLFSRQYIVLLPQLENLTFNDFGREKSPITMITPMLKVFVMRSHYASAPFPLEMDLGLLTHVRVQGKQIPPLLELSGLKVLHLFPDSPYYSGILKPLVDDPSVCRELEIVELRLWNRSDADYSDFQKLFSRINGPRTDHIEHYIQNRFPPWHKVLPQVGHYIAKAVLWSGTLTGESRDNSNGTSKRNATYEIPEKNPKTKKMDFRNVGKSSSLAGYAGDTSPLRAKLLSALDNYDKENLPGPSSNLPQRQTPSKRLSLPLGLNTSINRSPLQERGQLVPSLNRPVPRRARVTDGGATSSLLTEGIPGAFQCATPKKRSAAVAEIDDSPSPPKRPRQETSDPKPVSFTSWALVEEDPEDKAASDDEGLEDDVRRAVPVAEVAAMLSMAPEPWPRRKEPIAESSSSVVDAHFGAAWDEFTGRAIESTSGRGHFLPVFEDDWYHDLLDHENKQGDQTTIGLSSQKSGGNETTTEGDILEGENRVDALDAPSVPDTDGFDESLLPVPVMLALRAYQAIKPHLDQIAEEGPVSRPQTSASPLAGAAGLLDATPPPPVQIREHQEAVRDPPAEGVPPAAQEVNTRRKTRSAQIRPEIHLKKSQASPRLAPASLEIEPQAPKAQKTRSGGVKKTGLKPTLIQTQSAPAGPAVLPSPSRALEVAPTAPRPACASGVARRTGRKPKAAVETVQEAQSAVPQLSATQAVPQLPEAKRAATTTTRGPNASQAHSNGVVGSSVAGPSNSPLVGQPLYPPALAQRIWDLAEAGKYHAAHGLFHPQERFSRIVGEDEVRKYLRDHPEAGEKLKPLARGGVRKELFLCRSRTFWVPAEKTQGEKKEGSRPFVLEHRTTDCPVGYATDHNLYKHVYKFHLKKEYGDYPRKGSTGKEPKKPAKGKGKARQTQRKPRAPKKDEDEGDYEDDGDEDYGD